MKITIKPEIYLQHKKTGKFGAIKVHIAKTENNRLIEASRKYAATIIKYGFIDYGYENADIDCNACVSLDIFEKSYSCAPSAYKRSINSLTVSCEEIAMWWDKV